MTANGKIPPQQVIHLGTDSPPWDSNPRTVILIKDVDDNDTVRTVETSLLAVQSVTKKANNLPVFQRGGGLPT
jgi:hypothetical protein